MDFESAYAHCDTRQFALFYAKRFAVDSFLRAPTSVTPVHKHNSHPGARLHAKKVERPQRLLYKNRRSTLIGHLFL